MFGAHGSATPGHSRPHSRPLRLTNYAPKSQTILPANFYPSNNTLIQALLVLLITNMISMGKTWSDLLKLCAASSSSPPLSKLSPLSAEAYSPPAQPRPNLNAAPGFASRSQAASRRLPPLTFQYTVLYWAAPTLVTQRNTAQTAPPDCSQTQLKSDHLSHLRQTQSTFHRTTTS